MQYIGLRARATPYQLRVAVAVQCASAGDIIRIIGHCAVSEHRRGRFAPPPRPYQRGVGTAPGYGQATSVDHCTLHVGWCAW